MMLIDCEINVILTLSENCFFVQAITAIQVQTFSVTDTKHYVPIVTLLTQDNSKLFELSKFGFERTIS